MKQRQRRIAWIIGLAAATAWAWWLWPPSQAAADQLPSPAQPQPLRIGTNLGRVIDWNPQWVFVDAFQFSRPWVSQNRGGEGPWNNGMELRTTPEGWPLLEPGQAAATLMFRDVGGRYPAGVYHCTYEGTGRIHFGYDAQVVRGTHGNLEVLVKPSDQGIYLRIDESDPNDPIRNIHLRMPGTDDVEGPFHPLFLERLRPFKTLRFMDWQQTNGSPLEHWSQRPTPQMARQSGRTGVALEYMIQLCNELGADAWFCIPHRADDDFVRNFAQLVRDQLHPDLKVYVEYSNEIWNNRFSQARYCTRKGKELGLSDNDYQARLRYQAQRSVEIFNIWEEVWGGTSRLVRVLATQAVNPWVTEQLLTWQDAHQHADALAVAGYFGYPVGGKILEIGPEKATVDDVLRLAGEDLEQTIREIRKQKKLADRHHLELIAYEGGQHLVAPQGHEDETWLTDLLIAANRHPQMYNLYARMFQGWVEDGGGPFAVFSYITPPNKWGSWGILEYQDQPLSDAPKYRAVYDAAMGRLPLPASAR